MNTIRKSLNGLRGLASFVDLVRHPDHLDQVFALADTFAASNQPMLRAMADSFAKAPSGARAFADRPRIGPIDLDALAALPEGTLGRAFAHHMKSNGLDPSSIPTRVATNDLEYMRAHLFETHDVWHAVTGFGADIAGEVGLQAFYVAQFPARLGTAILSMVMLNTTLYAIDERNTRMRAIVRGWLLGQKARPFFGVDWKSMWATPLDRVRRDLGVEVDAIEATLPAAA